MKLPKSNKYPKQVRIKDEEYQLRMMKKVFTEDKRVGNCDDVDKILKVLQTQGSVELFRTVIHEIVHAMDYEYKMKLTHKQVYKLEDALSDFLMQNF